MRTAKVIAVLVAGVVVTSCTAGADHISSTRSSAARPTTASARPQATPALALAHSPTDALPADPTPIACRPAAIRAHWVSYAPAETSERGAVIGLTNESRRTCTMFGYPTVEAFNSHGRRLPLHIIEAHSGYVTAARPRPVAVQPQADAEFILATEACPDPAVPEPEARHVAFLTVGIPSAPDAPLRLQISAAHLPVTAVPLCPGTGPNSFAVSPVEPNLKAAV